MFELVARTWTPEFLQKPLPEGYTGWDFATQLFAAAREGQMYVYQYPKYKTVFVVQPSTQYIGEVHVFSEGGLVGIAKAYDDFLDQVSATAPFTRLEIRTRHHTLARIAVSRGGVLEGKLRKSYRTRNGGMVDTYMVGHLLWDL